MAPYSIKTALNIKLFAVLEFTMTTPSNYRRPAFKKRPWVTGALYDVLARDTILHCDAYVIAHVEYDALVIQWRIGGGLLHAWDAWRIEPDGLTPLWDQPAAMVGARMYWTRANAPWMARVHKTVVRLAEEAEARGEGGCMRVSLLCHYVHVRDRDTEIPRERNQYKERRPRGAAPDPGPEVAKRPRGRPRKVERVEEVRVVASGKLPDWL